MCGISMLRRKPVKWRRRYLGYRYYSGGCGGEEKTARLIVLTQNTEMYETKLIGCRKKSLINV
jgi:hypothetical protein